MSTNYERWPRSWWRGRRRWARSRPKRSCRSGASVDVRVRDGEIEDLTQATSKGVGLRVFVKNRLGFSWTSLTSSPAVWTRSSIAPLQLAQAAAPNPLNGPARRSDLGVPRPSARSTTVRSRTCRPTGRSTPRSRWKKPRKRFDPRIKTIDQRGRRRAGGRGAPGLERRRDGQLRRAPASTSTRRRWRPRAINCRLATGTTRSDSSKTSSRPSPSAKKRRAEQCACWARRR